MATVGAVGHDHAIAFAMAVVREQGVWGGNGSMQGQGKVAMGMAKESITLQLANSKKVHGLGDCTSTAALEWRSGSA